MKQGLSDYVDYFLYTVKQIEVAKTTFVGYENICKNIKAYFVHRTLDEIKKRDIQCYFKYLSDKKISINTIRKHYDLLNQIFRSAIDDELILTNPLSRLKKPKREDFFCEVYNEQESLCLLKASKGTDLFLPIVFALLLGLRRGEICGLTWNRVNLEEQYLLLTDSRTTAGTEIVTKKVKITSSVRKMYLSTFLKELLEQEKEKQQQRLPQEEIEQGYVCLRQKNMEPIHPDYISNAYPKLLKRHNLKRIRFHDLRHSCASIANHNGKTLHNISY